MMCVIGVVMMCSTALQHLMHTYIHTHLVHTRLMRPHLPHTNLPKTPLSRTHSSYTHTSLSYIHLSHTHKYPPLTVTEEVTGVDIVQMQILIAGGAKLSDLGFASQVCV